MAKRALDAALRKALTEVNLPAIRDLISRGAKVDGTLVNSRDELGVTPLWLAAFGGDEAVVAALIAGGADINVRDSRGISPLALARMGHHYAVVELLRNAGAKEEEYPDTPAGRTARFLDDLYAEADEALYPSRRYLLSRLYEIRQYDEQQLVAHLFQHWDHRTGQVFLLSLPELWEAWRSEQWGRLFSLVSPRPKPAPFFMDGYGDVQFFCSYLGLNPFPLVMGDYRVQPEDRARIVEQVRVHAPVYLHARLSADDDLMSADESAEQYSDPEEGWHAGELARIRSVLIGDNPDLLPTWNGSEAFQTYIDALREGIDRAGS